MPYNILKPEVRESIAIVTISRPQALNALNSEFFREMNAWLDEVGKNPDIRVMILTGEGKAFVAGADIAEMADMGPEEGKKFSLTGQATFQRIEDISIPVIAAVNGFALGGGCELAMACDIRIASVNAKFGQPEVNLGLIPGYAGTQRLSRIVGLSNALYLLMTADMIPAAEAFRMGLVQKVTEPEQLLEEAWNMARKISSKGPLSVKNVKKVTREGMELPFADACSLEAEYFGNSFGNGESGEGMKAFLEKRNPKW